jgi:sugar/nucleoside kinase (ribokinase family)
MKKILAMGNALVDILIRVESDAIPAMLSLPKGSMQLVDRERSATILEALKTYPKSLAAGGSAANTIHGLAKLGAPTGYIGVVGEDELGGSFVRDLITAGVEPHMIHSQEETGRAIALVTPDSERTFATYLGAAIELTADHLNPGIFKKYDIFHLEGYLVQNHDLVRKALEIAKAARLTVSLDMASYNVVEANREFLLEMIKGYVDILFANEEEAMAFTGEKSEKALEVMSGMVDIAVVKTGRNGSLIKRGGETCSIGIIPVVPVDTTGAGDLYASGFLYGLSNGYSLQRCGELGALLAGNVIECMGAKMDVERWERIMQILSGN